MKDAIKEYLNLTEEEKNELWNNAVFVFDTNIFLNLYRYTEVTRDSLLNAMSKLSDRIWMPKQVAYELMKDRPAVIFDTLKVFDEIKCEKDKFIRSCTGKLRRENSDKKIEEFSNAIDDFIEKLKKESHFVEDINDDKILKNLLELFDKKVGNGFDDESLQRIKTDGKKRYENKTPPGYKDCEKGEQNNSYGDLIIWKEIIEYAKHNKKDIIYVTGDQKEDWWYRVNGRTLGPRVELRKEFWDETNQKFHMYNMNNFLVQFKAMHENQIQQSAIDEVKNYEDIIEKKRRALKHEQAIQHDIERLSLDRKHLISMLFEIAEEQDNIETHISDLEQLLNDNNVEFKDLSRYMYELKMEKAHLDDILHKKQEIQHAINNLGWKQREFINLSERSAKERDQL